MAWEKDMVIDGTRTAAADLSAKQFYFVKLDGSGNVAAITALTDVPYGVLLNKPNAAGKQADVCRLALACKVSADAALSIGDMIGPSADGQADARVIGTDTTHYVAGMMIEATSGANSIGVASINCLNPHRAA